MFAVVLCCVVGLAWFCRRRRLNRAPLPPTPPTPPPNDIYQGDQPSGSRTPSPAHSKTPVKKRHAPPTPSSQPAMIPVAPVAPLQVTFDYFF